MPKTNQDRTPDQSAPRQSHWQRSLMSQMQSSQARESSDINLGKRLQELRVSSGLSMRSLAELSGLNFNTLSLIENEKTSPNVNTLQQIASALNVTMGAFFETVDSHKDIIFQKHGNHPASVFPQGKLEDLGGGLALGNGTPLLMTSKPHTNSGSDGIVHSGQEFVYCLEGCIVYWVGEQEYYLEPGDSLIFQAQISHRWENREDIVNRSILVICPSDQTDRLVGQHLKKEDV